VLNRNQSRKYDIDGNHPFLFAVRGVETSQ
jgi:hypothetical protein